MVIDVPLSLSFPSVQPHFHDPSEYDIDVPTDAFRVFLRTVLTYHRLDESQVAKWYKVVIHLF